MCSRMYEVSKWFSLVKRGTQEETDAMQTLRFGKKSNAVELVHATIYSMFMTADFGKRNSILLKQLKPVVTPLTC